MGAAKVLVIEDEPDIRELVRVNLELAGYDVVVAEDGESGLDTVRQARPDLVLLDVMLPGIDGWEVLTRLKAESDPALATVPVLMLTARTGTMDRLRGEIEGAIRYLTKPFSPDDLQAEVAAALAGDPEPVQRARVQKGALAELGRLESGELPGAPASTAAHPRLSRLESAPTARAAYTAPPSPGPSRLGGLSVKQRELLTAVGTTATVSEAAERLEVSRSNVYASLRRIARRLDIHSVTELVHLARAGGLH